MNLESTVTGYVRTLFLITSTILAPSTRAATLWNGPTITFTKAAFADWTQPENQDRITDNVWITRTNAHGIFNARTEAFFTHALSPADTAWASGQLADYASLTFTDWDTWATHFPVGTIGQGAVVHLVSDDIYLSIKFNSWSQAASGGGFSYDRSTPGSGPPPPPPAPTITSPVIAPDGTFSFTFTNTPGNTFTVLATTNISLPLTNWTVVGTVTDSPPGSGMYRFVDPGAGTNQDQRHYVVRLP